MLQPRRTFIVRVHGEGTVVVEDTLNQLSERLESLGQLSEQIERWLGAAEPRAPAVEPLATREPGV